MYERFEMMEKKRSLSILMAVLTAFAMMPMDIHICTETLR